MAEFVKVARADELGEGEMQAFEVQGATIAVANVAGSFHAFDDTCTHEECSLAEEGELEETTVICGCHGAEFDATSGEVLEGPATEPVGSYEVRVEGDDIEVNI